MAKALNKTRIRDSKIVFTISILVLMISEPLIQYEGHFHEFIEFVGYFFIIACVLGRMFSTAFLGGNKNEKLIVYGPFSVSRNPLYLSSIIGIVGLSMVSGYFSIFFLNGICFLVLYHYLIRREEDFLKEKFPKSYQTYFETTPRLIPDFSKYNCPKEIKVRTDLLLNAIKDSIWWFALFPLFELIEYFHEIGLLKAYVKLP